MELRIQQWIPLLEAQAKSGMTKQDWCTANGIERSSFYRWQRECRNYLIEKQQTDTIASTACVKNEANTSAFVEIPMHNPSAVLNDSMQVSSIDLTVSGITISLKGDVNEVNLMKVLKVISNVH